MVVVVVGIMSMRTITVSHHHLMMIVISVSSSHGMIRGGEGLMARVMAET